MTTTIATTTSRPSRCGSPSSSAASGRDASGCGWTVGRQAGALSPEWKVDLIDLAELSLAVDLGASAATAELASRIDDAAAVLVVTCEYNHGGAPYTPYGYTVRMCWHQRPALRTEVIDA